TFESLRRLRDVGRTRAHFGHLGGVFEVDLPRRAAQTATFGRRHPHGDLRQPGCRACLALDEAAPFVSYYEHLLHQIVDFLRTNPEFPQKVRDEPSVASEQLACVQALLRLGLAFCHVLYVPLPWIAGCLKTFTSTWDFSIEEFDCWADSGAKQHPLLGVTRRWLWRAGIP